MSRTFSRLGVLLAATLALSLSACAAPPASAPAPTPHPYAGADFSVDADATDVGLPVFPGARLQSPHNGDDKPALNLSIWGGTLGLRVAVIKLRSDAPIADVAAFYRRAMARRGPWRDCARPGAASAPGAGPDCSKSEIPRGGFLFKAGVDDEEVRTVALSPHDEGGVQIQLVRVAFGREAALR